MEQAVTSAQSVGSPIEAPTVCEAFQRIVAQRPDDVALRTKGDELSLTWAQFDERVRLLGAGLAALGVVHGDTVAMLLPNIPECHMVDFAAMHLGAVPFTIYNSSSPEQIQHQLSNADAKVLVCQEAFLDRVDAARPGLPALEHVVVVDGDGGTTSLAAVEAAGDPAFDFAAAWRAVDAEDLVTIIYTSGTTGPPKGAEWAHRTAMSQLRALDAVVPLPSLAVISFLPMAHAGGRITSHYMALPYGAAITTCPDMRELPAYLPAVRPDALFSVPRLWEKFQVAIEAMVEAQEDVAKAPLQDAIQRGLAAAKASEAPDPVDVALLQPIIARLGLDRIKAAFVGGAPSAPELSEFFRAVGVPLLEAYGLTEGSLNIFNRVERFKGGTAGKPLPGVELRLARAEGGGAEGGPPDVGEMLIRSALNMVGYRKDPEKTAEALDVDGWLHTGDIAEVDDEGFVKIVDRKKEIIISAAGKNMSPANIESAIKGESSLIGQIVTIGDGRRYNTALITLDPEAAPMYAKRLGLEGRPLPELAEAPEMLAEIQAAVDRGNERLSRVEQIRKFKLLPDIWLPDGEELTPTMKLKRKPIEAKYAKEINVLYAEERERPVGNC